MTQTWSILLAAGQGSRLKEALRGASKQFVPFGGEPLFWRSATTIASVPMIHGLVLVLPESGFEAAEALAAETDRRSPLGIPLKTVRGNIRRQDSVWNGLCALPPACTHVLVHDSARPFASAALFRSVLAALCEGRQGVIPGLEPSDTIKEIDDRGMVSRTPERSSLRGVQTPQGFERAVLYDAHVRCRENGWTVTDDAALLERCGLPVLVVPGEAGNRKITTPEDLELLKNAENRNVSANMQPCTGFGYDVHAYGGNRPFILGGVRITSTDIALKAHSDGDVLLHALIDALLGLFGGGDIGGLFPDSDQKFDNISSAVLLAETLEMTRREGIILTHADMTVVAQTPKIAPFRREIARNVAHLLQLDGKCVNVKATTEEGLGFTGARQGVKAMAVVTGLRLPGKIGRQALSGLWD